MQLKSNLNHVFTSFSTKPPNNYRIFCGNKQIQSKYIPILRYYHFTVPPPTALSKAPPPLRPHQPSQNRTIPRKALSHLPPLSKVRCCRPKKFGRLPEGLLLHQPSQNRTIPCFAPSHLPPLSKGGGLTARHKLLLCYFLLAICPPFLYYKLFGVKTEGLFPIRTIILIGII